MSVLNSAKKYYTYFVRDDGEIVIPDEIKAIHRKITPEQKEFFTRLYMLVTRDEFANEDVRMLIKSPLSLRDTIRYKMCSADCDDEEITRNCNRITTSWTRVAKKLDQRMEDPELVEKVLISPERLQKPIKHYTKILYELIVEIWDTKSWDEMFVIPVRKGSVNRDISDEEYDNLLLGMILLSKNFADMIHRWLTDDELGYYKFIITSFFNVTEKEGQRFCEIQRINKMSDREMWNKIKEIRRRQIKYQSETAKGLKVGTIPKQG